MDEIDRRIIAAVQGGLGTSMTPWQDAAGRLKLAPEELVGRLERLRGEGVLRGVRAVLDARKLGVEGGVLVAWRVPDERVDAVGALFAARPEVTHCVLRTAAPDWPYNLYTMIHAETSERAHAVVRELVDASRCDDVAILETVRELKKSPPRYVR
ncbi:MAG TPA: Lrp/AsnC family transcriptional regulator [Planctomycetota bacterium]|nr:Lrp/AsnC family transcriptional regulator [Planctomycetota bacterium]